MNYYKIYLYLNKNYKMNLRIEQIFKEEMSGDTSFQEKDTGLEILFGRNKYSKIDMRETWDKGIKLGIEIGLSRNNLNGQIIELNKNTNNKRHKEFLNKFFKLSEEYKCAIQYHPIYGMVIIDKK